MIPRLLAAVAALALLLFAPGTASAAETRTSEQITIASDQQVDGDLYAFGREIVVRGIVNGDLIGAAETVRITGTINGSVNVAARTIEISGTVTHSARVTGDSVTVSGSIQGDLVVGANSARVSSNGEIGGDVLVGSGDLTVTGPVGRDIRGSSGDLTIDGRVGRHVRVSADSLTVTSQGRIGGDLRYASNQDADISNSAQISGQTVRTSSWRMTGGPDVWSALTSPITRILLALITGLLLVLSLPRALVAVADTIRTRVAESAAAGAIGFILWPILAIVFLVMVVGIPVALIGTALFVSFAYLSQIFVGLAIGRAVLPGAWKVRSRGYNVLAMVIGVILIGAVRAVPVPYLSPILAAITAVIGVGGILLALHNARSTEIA